VPLGSLHKNSEAQMVLFLTFILQCAVQKGLPEGSSEVRGLGMVFFKHQSRRYTSVAQTILIFGIGK